MDYKVFYTAHAENDIKCIFEYISYTLSVPNAAKRLVNEIMKEISALDKMPMRYPLYKKEPWKSRGLRSFPINNYMVFYVVDDDKKTVTIVRIMYGGRNIERQLDEYGI